jgi:hypothetical protein
MFDEVLLAQIEAALEDWLAKDKPDQERNDGPLYQLEDDAKQKRLKAALIKAGYLTTRSRSPSAIPRDPDALLTADQLAAALTELGFRISARTLDTWVSRPGPNGSPPWQKWGVTRLRLYRWGSARVWAEKCLGPLARTAAESRRLSCP